MGDSSDHGQVSAFPGSVLVAGCGFIVTAAAWGLFGFLEEEMAQSPTAIVYFVFALAYAILGVAILKRRSETILSGSLVAVAGVFVALAKPQFVLVFTNVVIFTLLILARNSIRDRGAG